MKQFGQCLKRINRRLKWTQEFVFYQITQCGYYDHSIFQFGNIADILENVKTWITGKALNETQTYTVDPDNNESDILRTYCYSIASNSGEYLMTTWNENADVDDKMASMDKHGITGQAAVEAIAPPQGYVPGYPVFSGFFPAATYLQQYN